ncbi:IS3 family transposase [Actinopolymorpha pittospori]|uniref:Transposase n=2 Tax=Actinopolymorpha pittospori TaxID=648752 RepID=A0A927MV32_9ACTN|nr:putative transposase [Actinopolymorpha pittospori]
MSTAIAAAVDDAVGELVPLVGAKAGCAAVGVARASFYRARPAGKATAAPSPEPERKPQVQPRALSEAERAAVLEVLHSKRFADAAPATVYATLLDEGTYLASESTMYRLLRERGETGDRRRHATHPAKVKPELVAASPNQVWSWDITKLAGPAKWTYYYLYLILDIFSRYPVGWMVASRESATLAERLIAETVRKQQADRNQLTLHADRGSSMASKPVAFLLADLGVTKSHSRPHCSNDNPYSEAQFKTLKYRPDFPDRFGCIEDARVFCDRFFAWYAHDHRHSGIGLHTPADVHYGRAHTVSEARGRVLDAAHAAHPERFVRKPPQSPKLPAAAWINKPQDKEEPTQ